MLHVVCTGYHCWLFSLTARGSSKTVFIFKKLMGYSTLIIFLLGGVVKNLLPISHLHDQGFIQYASSLESDGDVDKSMADNS